MLSFDKEIWNKVQKGDQNAFEVIFKGSYSSLCAYAFDLLKDRDIAKEVVQEMMLKLWEERNQIVINVSLKSYLFRSIHNYCLNQLKHTSALKRRMARYEYESLTLSGQFNGNDETGQQEDWFYEGFENDVNEALEHLPEQCRKIFFLSRFDKQSYESIAQHLDISVNTVKTQMRRALEKLRVILSGKIQAHGK